MGKSRGGEQGAGMAQVGMGRNDRQGSAGSARQTWWGVRTEAWFVWGW